MSTLHTLTLDGWQLEYFTGLALGYEMVIANEGAGPAYLAVSQFRAYEPTRNPTDLFAVLMEMASVMQCATRGERWSARAVGHHTFAHGETLSVAVCRALVLRKFGLTVSLPGAVDGCEDLFA